MSPCASIPGLGSAAPPICLRRLPKRKDSRRRRFLSWGYNRLVRTLLGTRVRDCDCALKVFRRSALERLLPESPGFFVNAEMLTRARQLALPLVEVPVGHRPRLGGESKVSLAEIPRTLRTLLAFWWRSVVCSPPAQPVKVLQMRLPGDPASPRSTPVPSLSVPLPPAPPREVA